MRRFPAIFLALALLGLTALTNGADGVKADSKPRHFEVRMLSGNKFSPDSIEVLVGDTVTWINADDGGKHTATADDDSPVKFENVEVASGRFSKRVAFDKEGAVKYHCKIHPSMKGTITVTKPK